MATGYPVMVGTSRKSFLASLASPAGGAPVPVDERLPASLSTATWAMAQGAGMVRVHDVAATVQAAVLVGRVGFGRRSARSRAAPAHGGPGSVGGGNVKGKWAAGIPPRNFTWVIKDRLAMSERPGGFAPNHRKVRRQEEIIWLQVQGFTRVISLLPSSHNLQAYEERSMASVHFPLPPSGDTRGVLGEIYRELHGRLMAGERVLVHQEELGDRMVGVMAGYLLWSERLPSGPQAITVLEHMTGHPMGPSGRELVAFASELAPAAVHPGAGDDPPGGG